MVKLHIAYQDKYLQSYTDVVIASREWRPESVMVASGVNSSIKLANLGHCASFVLIMYRGAILILHKDELTF
jgi:hypothetical protein